LADKFLSKWRNKLIFSETKLASKKRLLNQLWNH
jgi:hypothetical protein